MLLAIATEPGVRFIPFDDVISQLWRQSLINSYCISILVGATRNTKTRIKSDIFVQAASSPLRSKR